MKRLKKGRKTRGLTLHRTEPILDYELAEPGFAHFSVVSNGFNSEHDERCGTRMRLGKIIRGKEMTSGSFRYDTVCREIKDESAREADLNDRSENFGVLRARTFTYLDLQS